MGNTNTSTIPEANKPRDRHQYRRHPTHDTDDTTAPSPDLVVDVALEGQLKRPSALGKGLSEGESCCGQLKVEKDARRLQRLTLRGHERRLHDVYLLAVEGNAVGFLEDLGAK